MVAFRHLVRSLPRQHVWAFKLLNLLINIINAFKHLFTSSFSIFLVVEIVSKASEMLLRQVAIASFWTHPGLRFVLWPSSLPLLALLGRKEGSEVCCNEKRGTLYIKKGPKGGGREIWCYGIWKGIQMDCLCSDCAFDSSVCSSYDRSTCLWVSFTITQILYLFDSYKI